MAGIVVGMLAAFVGLPPRLDAWAVAMFPPDHPQAAALRAMEEQGGANGIWLFFESDDAEALDRGLDLYLDALRGLEETRYAVRRLDDEVAMHAALMQVDPEAVRRYTHRVRGAVAMGSALNPFIAGPLLDAGALDTQLSKPADFRLFPQDRYGRIFLKPRRGVDQPEYSVRVMRELRAMLETTEVPGVRHVFSVGPYVVIANGVRDMNRDMRRATGMSAALVLLVLVVGFRSLRAPFLVFVPIGLANLLTFAMLALTVGTLNYYTVVAGAILIGLGVDFAVHLLGSFREQRATGLATEDALARAWGETGAPCITAALTSAMGFLSLGLAEFKGLAQLGFSLAGGLLLCLACMLVLLPALVAWLDDGDRMLLGAGGTGRVRGVRGARVALVGAVLVTIAAGIWGIGNTSFEYDFTKSARDDAVFENLPDALQDVTKTSYPPVVVPVASEVDLAAAQERLDAGIADGSVPHVERTLSMLDLFPSDQADRVEALAGLRELLLSEQARFLPARLQERFAPLKAWEPRVRTAEDLPEVLEDLLDRGRRILLIPSGEMHDMRVSRALVEALEDDWPEAASPQLAQGVLYRWILADTPTIVIGALLGVTFLVSIDLRRPRLVFMAVGALIGGMLWATAAISALSIKVTITNIVGIPILMGIGIDVVIHLVHRLRASGSISATYRTVGVAVALSTLTTMASFASLVFASNGGVRSIGSLVVVGLATLTVTSASLLALAWSASRTV